MRDQSGFLIRNVYRILMQEEKENNVDFKLNYEYFDKIQERVFKSRCCFYCRLNHGHRQNQST